MVTDTSLSCRCCSHADICCEFGQEYQPSGAWHIVHNIPFAKSNQSQAKRRSAAQEYSGARGWRLHALTFSALSRSRRARANATLAGDGFPLPFFPRLVSGCAAGFAPWTPTNPFPDAAAVVTGSPDAADIACSSDAAAAGGVLMITSLSSWASCF